MSEEHGRRRNVRLFVLIALGGTLAASAIIIVFFVILRPARISFSIIHTSHSLEVLYLTIAANNTSHQRAAVQYRSVFVNLIDSSDPEGTSYIAEIENHAPTEYLRAAEPTSINAFLNVPFNDYGENDTIGSGRTLTVVVKVQASFKIWKARTKLYNIQVSCSDVVFPTLSVIPCT